MSLAQRQPYWSVEEYFAHEEHAEERSEYYQGEIYAMAGGSANHNRIAGNLYVALMQAPGASECEPFINDVRLHLGAVGLYTYPDVMLVCGGVEYLRGRSDTITNPSLIVEVLSASTAAYDRSKKFESYRTLDSLEEYLLVDQDRFYVEHFRRLEDGQWVLRVLQDEADILHLECAAIEVPLTQIYQRVEWDTESHESGRRDDA